jgi:ABC-type nickel/cobalt efflux system permease component RcnA
MTGQTIWFGFTGGLMPCPAAIAVLLICVQLKAFALGVAMIAAFSLGVGLTLIAIGLAVVWGAGKFQKHGPVLTEQHKSYRIFPQGLCWS